MSSYLSGHTEGYSTLTILTSLLEQLRKSLREGGYADAAKSFINCF